MGILKRLCELLEDGEKAVGVPIRDAEFVALDTELTGLDPASDSILSIGAVRMTSGRIMLGQSFYTVVNPTSELKGESVVVHGITHSELDGRPGPAEALSEFTAFCGDAILIGHCIDMDMEFIGKGLAYAGLPELTNPVADTLAIHNWLAANDAEYARRAPSASDASLYAIATSLGIPVNGAHNALMDAFITAQAFQAFIPLLERAGVVTTGGLSAVSIPVKGGEVFHPRGEITSF